MELEEEFKNFVYDKDILSWNTLITPDEAKIYAFICEKYENIPDDKVWELDSCVLIHLPISEQKRALDMFIRVGESLYSTVDDISKLIYILWNKRNGFEEELSVIENQLKDFAYTYTDTDRRNGTRFVYWNICGLYPLLGEEGKEMLVTVSKRRYNDAQDMMMFGIYHLNPVIDISYVKRIFRGWNETRNVDLGGGGTGIDCELKLILAKYTLFGYQPDEEFKELIN
jgi:hypothetical protein